MPTGINAGNQAISAEAHCNADKPSPRQEDTTASPNPNSNSTCNLQESIPLFGILLTDPIFASGKVPIP